MKALAPLLLVEERSLPFIIDVVMLSSPKAPTTIVSPEMDTEIPNSS